MATALKAIGELKDYSFTVPYYQRGYRWTKREVETLLNDLWKFSVSSYCLQPIVVKKKKKKNDNEYILVDGQQRLTTIYLIFKSFGWDELFKIDYETRKNSRDFLRDIREKDESEAKSNPDFYHMWNAYKVIKDWVIKVWKENKKEDSFENFILEKVKVIFYELEDEDDNGIKVFTRLNSGKVPLTDAELIRGSLLLEERFQSKDRRIQIAKEWDDINIEFQDDSFWYFLFNNDYDTRMDLLFEVFLDKERDELYGLFKEFENRWNSNQKSEEIWEEIKSIYCILRYWYENDILYHLIGFLIAAGHKKLNELYKDLRGNSRTKVLEDIRKKTGEVLGIEIKDKTLKIDNKEIKKLSYGENNKNNKRIERLLFFYNILLILNQVQIKDKETNETNLFQRLSHGLLENQPIWYRFPFKLYKNEGWSLEHIHARNAEGIKEKDREPWLELNKPFLERIKETLGPNDKAKEEIGQILERIESYKKIKNKEEKDEKFKELQWDILDKLSGLDEDSIDSLRNLTLLTTRDNSALNNQTFAVKRQGVIKWDKKGKFIPLGTKNVFLKHYSEDVKDPYLWRFEEDAEKYVEDIRDKIKGFWEICNE